MKITIMKRFMMAIVATAAVLVTTERSAVYAIGWCPAQGGACTGMQCGVAPCRCGMINNVLTCYHNDGTPGGGLDP
jgi:hypothetical protein